MFKPPEPTLRYSNAGGFLKNATSSRLVCIGVLLNILISPFMFFLLGEKGQFKHA
jgi:hypothetical protein